MYSGKGVWVLKSFLRASKGVQGPDFMGKLNRQSEKIAFDDRTLQVIQDRRILVTLPV